MSLPNLSLRRRQLLGAGLSVGAPWVFAQSSPPAKTDATTYFGRDQMNGAALSPDGKRLAMRVVAEHGRATLTVLDLATLKPSLVYSSDGADVADFYWVNDERLVFRLWDAETPDADQNAGPGLFAADHDGGRYKQLVARQWVWARNGSEPERFLPPHTQLLHGNMQRQGDEVFVFRLDDDTGNTASHFSLMRLNTVTGHATDVQTLPGSEGWWLDAQGEVRVCWVRKDTRASLRWLDPANKQWKTLTEFDVFGDAALSMREVGADGRLYLSAYRGGDRKALWSLDPATGEFSRQALASSPRFDVDAHLVQRQDRLLGLRFTIDAEVTTWLDGDLRGVQAHIDKVLPRTVNRLTVPWRGAEPWVLIEAWADIQPTLYFLFNRESRKFTRLGAQRPAIVAKTQGASELFWFKARDGLEQPVWLTLPPGQTLADKPRLPTVVLVHGGPWVPMSPWHWDPEVQFLVSRGYAVLQPQFRGTLGLGSKSFKASFKQWGRTMQDDVADATRWAIGQGAVDPKRVAIAGASYGGYATLMGLARDPELYRCGVAWVAVSDLALMQSATWSDMSDLWKQHGLPKMVGDKVKDAEDFKAYSPVHVAARIRQPLLLAHGQKDRRVPIEHGKAMHDALVAAGNQQVDWVVYPKEGHGWREPAVNVEFWNRVADFLDRHLGPLGA